MKSPEIFEELFWKCCKNTSEIIT